MTFERTLWGYVVIIVLAVAALLLGYPMVGWLISYGGTSFWIFFCIVVCAAKDPKNRWPGASFGTRLANILTFRH